MQVTEFFIVQLPHPKLKKRKRLLLPFYELIIKTLRSKDILFSKFVGGSTKDPEDLEVIKLFHIWLF